jgi:ribosome maturation factor RimP
MILCTFALSLGEICSGGAFVPYFITKKMITTESITELIAQHLESSDIFLVEVVVKPGNAIRVHVDSPDGISIDECVKISRFMNESLDRDVEDYSMEVSSPGLGGSFRVKQQYEKNVGRAIEVLYTDGIKVNGKLVSVSEKGIVLMVNGDDEEIGFEEIKTAKAIIAFN